MDKSILAYNKPSSETRKIRIFGRNWARIQTYSSRRCCSPPRTSRNGCKRLRIRSTKRWPSIRITPRPTPVETRPGLDGFHAPDDSTRSKISRQPTMLRPDALLRDPQNALGSPSGPRFWWTNRTGQPRWTRVPRRSASGPTIMDVHRAYAYVLESQCGYNGAISEYQLAMRLIKFAFSYTWSGSELPQTGAASTTRRLLRI